MTVPADLALALARTRGEQLAREAARWRLAHGASSAHRDGHLTLLRPRRRLALRRLTGPLHHRAAPTVVGLARVDAPRTPWITRVLRGTTRSPHPCGC